MQIPRALRLNGEFFQLAAIGFIILTFPTALHMGPWAEDWVQQSPSQGREIFARLGSRHGVSLVQNLWFILMGGPVGGWRWTPNSGTHAPWDGCMLGNLHRVHLCHSEFSSWMVISEPFIMETCLCTTRQLQLDWKHLLIKIKTDKEEITVEKYDLK